jgi:hypothetical protein
MLENYIKGRKDDDQGASLSQCLANHFIGEFLA